MKIISFLSPEPGVALVNGKKLELDDLFVLLQEPGLDRPGKNTLKEFLRANGFNPNPNLSIGKIVIDNDYVCFQNGGLSFKKRIDEIPPGRVVYHPNGWSKHCLTDEEMSLIIRSKRRVQMLK
jgi:hypothetical protein